MRRSAAQDAAAGRSRSSPHELGVSPQSLRNWARQIDVDEGKAEGLSSTSVRSCAGCGARTGSLTEEREILKKAAAFFAKDGGTR